MKESYKTSALIAFYEQNVKKYKDSIKSPAWGSRNSQEKRFSILAGIARLEGKTILDVGSGLGDFYGWLKKRYPCLKYAGVDITPSMVKRALLRYPGATFKVEDVLALKNVKPQYDYVFASGIFNRRIPHHLDFMREVITKMFELCRRGIAFNCMSTKADFKESREYYADPSRTLDFCLTLSRKVVLRHDYIPHDFTVYIYKERCK